MITRACPPKFANKLVMTMLKLLRGEAQLVDRPGRILAVQASFGEMLILVITSASLHKLERKWLRTILGRMCDRYVRPPQEEIVRLGQVPVSRASFGEKRLQMIMCACPHRYGTRRVVTMLKLLRGGAQLVDRPDRIHVVQASFGEMLFLVITSVCLHKLEHKQLRIITHQNNGMRVPNKSKTSEQG